MNEERIECWDFLECAYLLYVSGGSIEKVRRVRELGKERIVVTVSGKDLSDAERTYQNGSATVNLRDYNRCYQRVRQVAYGYKRGTLALPEQRAQKADLSPEQQERETAGGDL